VKINTAFYITKEVLSVDRKTGLDIPPMYDNDVCWGEIATDLYDIKTNKESNYMFCMCLSQKNLLDQINHD